MSLCSRLRFGRRHRREPELRRHQLGEGETPKDGLHQRTAAGAGTRVPREKVPIADRTQPDRLRPQTERGAGEDLVPEQTRQMEKGEGRPGLRTASRHQGHAAQEQIGGAYSGAREPFRRQKSAPAVGKGARRLGRQGSGESCGPEGRPGFTRVSHAAATPLVLIEGG